MNRETVLDLVERRLSSIPGVKSVRYLTSGMREEIARLENVAEIHGAVGGLMKFRNKGVWEVLDREVCLVMIMRHGYMAEPEKVSTVYIVDQAGQVLGESVTPERRDEVMRSEPGSFMLTEDFVMHAGWRSVGEPYFLIDEVVLHDLDDIKEVYRVTSGSLTAATDEVVRDIFGFSGTDEYTRLIGFDLDL